VVFDLRDSNIYRLRYYLALCSWDNVYSCVDINVKFQNFVNVLLILMSQRIRSYFYNEMRYTNLRFTYLLTYSVYTS